MRTILWLIGFACFCALIFWSCSGPSDAEIDATQDTQCVRWGAARGSHDYIQCRATLAVNYHREQTDQSNANAAGAAMVMSGMAAAQAGSRR